MDHQGVRRFSSRQLHKTVWLNYREIPNGQKLVASLPHARTSLQAQVHDKSGWVELFLGQTARMLYICEIARRSGPDTWVTQRT